MKNIEKQSNTDNDSIYVYNYCKLLKFTLNIYLGNYSFKYSLKICTFVTT